MSDDERQAQALRNGLDRELASVRATTQARDRLIRSTAARRPAERRSTPPTWRLRPIFALPLAGALVAGVIAAAVVVPNLVRTDPRSEGPAGGGITGPSSPARPPASATPTPEPPTSTASAARPEPTAATRATEPPIAATPGSVIPTASSLRLSVSPSTPTAGERVLLSLSGGISHRGAGTVDWGDRTTDSTVSGSCTRATRAEALTHSYARAGTYRVTAVFNLCGSPSRAELTVVVEPLAAPLPSR